LTVLAGAVIGLNRGARGHAAGLRATILVALAACVAMIQANILLPVDGKTGGSFKQIVCEGSGGVRLSLEVSWRQAEADGPPLKLIELLNGNYPVVSFELTSDNHV
jgi:hypothetical protein